MERKLPPVDTAPESPEGFVSSGACLTDLVLGGGWDAAGIINIGGESSTGKTLLGYEACHNFRALANNPKHIKYRDNEKTSELDFAQSMGFPSDVELIMDGKPTIEALTKDLENYLDGLKDATAGLYVVDSLDAFSDNAELARDVEKNTYGMDKAAAMSLMFRRVGYRFRDSNASLMLMSQLRDNITTVPFAEKSRQSGGRALRFWVTQWVWLYEVGKITVQHRNEKRVTGVKVRVKCRKNKRAVAFRECEVPLVFGYGIDDEQSMLDYLHAFKEDDLIPGGDYKVGCGALDDLRQNRDRNGVKQFNAELRKIVQQRWNEIEEHISPKMTKY